MSTKKPIDPKTLRKRVSTDFTMEEDQDFVPASTAASFSLTVPTPTGATSEVTNAAVETYVERMVAGTVTNTFMHPGKVRTVVVLEGTGELHLKNKEEESVVVLSAGTIHTLVSDVSYRIHATTDLLMAVSQEEKYDARLQMVAVTCVNASNAQVAATPTTRRRQSKAAQQLQSAKLRKDGRSDEPRAVEFSEFTAGLNPKPSMGRFSEEGAG